MCYVCTKNTVFVVGHEKEIHTHYYKPSFHPILFPTCNIHVLTLLCFVVKQSLEECIKQAGQKRNWSAVRYSSSLLKQMIDSISPYITQILVSGKRVTVGTIGKSFTSFDKPQTPTVIYEAIYNNVQPYNIISAVLQQELILYCGKLIASKPELFAGLLVIRMG